MSLSVRVAVQRARFIGGADHLLTRQDCLMDFGGRMTLAVEGVTYQAESRFAKIKAIAVLLLSGDAARHGQRWDEVLSVSKGSHSDLGHEDRLLWLSFVEALRDMGDEGEVLRAKVEAHVVWMVSGESASFRERCDIAVQQRHAVRCLSCDSKRTPCGRCLYCRGRERLYSLMEGEPAALVSCRCLEDGIGKGLTNLEARIHNFS